MENKNLTAVEWLQTIELERDLTLADWKQAKEMEKQQMNHIVDTNKMVSSQTEISDEEIEKGAKDWYEKKGLLRPYQIEKMAWISAIKWYREQLKKRNNNLKH